MSLLKEYYDRTAERYWSPQRALTGRDAAVYPLLAGFGGRDCSVLDYGFGSGSLLFLLAKEDRFSSVVGVEISSKQIQRCRTELGKINEVWCKKVSLLEPAYDCLPTVADMSIDVVLCLSTVDFVLDPHRLFDEFFRVATPDARLVCSVGNLAYLKHRIRLLLGKLPQLGTEQPVSNWRAVGWDGMRLHNFTKQTFATLLMDCGWQPVSWAGWGERLRLLRGLRSRFPGLLSGELIVTCCKRSHA